MAHFPEAFIPLMLSHLLALLLFAARHVYCSLFSYCVVPVPSVVEGRSAYCFAISTLIESIDSFV